MGRSHFNTNLGPPAYVIIAPACLDQQTKTAQTITWKKRLVCLLSGCILVAISIWAIQHGKLGYISERYRQPVFVSEIGAVGIVLIAEGSVPTSLMRKLTALRKYRPFKLRSRASAQTAGSLTKSAKPK